MLLKKIIGLLIIFLNVAGVGFLIFLLITLLQEKFLSQSTESRPEKPLAQTEKPAPAIKNDDIVTDEDDLLKDMDLSDLDNLNLDDFD